MDPITGAAIASSIFQIWSGVQQAETIRANAALSKEIADMNAGYAELDAYNAEQDGLSQEARYQSAIDQIVGSQRVAFAAADVDVNFGTAKAVQEESKLAGFLNRLDIINQAHKVALGYKNQARNIRISGAMGMAQANYNAGAVQNAGIMQGVSTGISGWDRYEERKSRLEAMGTSENQAVNK